MRILYDGDCPFCSHYVTLHRLRARVGEVSLINLRESPGELTRLLGLGLSPDQGFVVEENGRLYHGAAAMHRIEAATTPHDVSSSLQAWVFRSSFRAELLYPLLRFGRNFALLMLGRPALRQPDEGASAQFTLFAHAFGVFALLHLVVYAFQYRAWNDLTPTIIVAGVLGFVLALRPDSRRIFAVLLALLLVDAILQMPVGSNHTFLKNYLNLAMLGAGAWAALRGLGWDHFTSAFAPVGRSLLCVMYIFGVFHKINSGFLDPSVSCAVALWRQMPWPLPLLDTTWFHHTAIWGTLIVEGLILLGLLVPRLRRAAIVVGIAFHSMLALSSYALFPPFSTLTIALHLLFLSPEEARAVVKSSAWQTAMQHAQSRRGLLVAAIWGGAVAALASNGSWSQAGLVWLVWVAWLCGVLGMMSRPRSAQRTGVSIIARPRTLNVITMVFFLACSAPYLGLKTGQSMNMFANLHLESGRSNHLVFSSPPAPFPYLQDTVEILDSSGSPYLAYIQAHGLHMTYYDLLDHFDRFPEGSATFVRAGHVEMNTNASSLHGELSDKLHPRWVRNVWMTFNPVDPRNPKACAIDR